MGLITELGNLFAEVERWELRVATVVMTEETLKQLKKEDRKRKTFDPIGGKGTRARRKLGYKAVLWGAEVLVRQDIRKTHVIGDNNGRMDGIIGLLFEIDPIPEKIEVFKEHEVTE
jgi:hypothetical protein